MANPWQLYDDLIDLVPPGIRVRDAVLGVWACVRTDAGTGVAMAYEGGPRSSTTDRDIVGRDLRDVAALVKSWDLAQAALGTAALSAALNTPDRLAAYPEPPTEGESSGLDRHAQRFADRRVAVIGHFHAIERYLDGTDVLVLERNPVGQDLPDPACEYELGDREYVFITGSAVTNKTLPRLLTLSGHARVILVGPSTPFAPEVFGPAVAEIDGSTVSDPELVRRAFLFGGGLSEARPGLTPFTRLTTR